MARKLSLSLLLQSYPNFKKGNRKLSGWISSKEGRKSKGKIRIAVMRKIFGEIYQMLKKMEYHNFIEEKNHKEKMTWYDNFLIKELKIA